MVPFLKKFSCYYFISIIEVIYLTLGSSKTN